jgi:hypothetical protein
MTKKIVPSCITVAMNDRMSRALIRRRTTIRIKNEPRRAVITVPQQAALSDDIKLRLIAWLVSDIARKLDVGEIELDYDIAGVE